jgi:3-methyladenine DNA glycosylase/8-oxoguanine DNA glycosylase
VPVWDFHQAGVDPRRARAVVAAARLAHRLEDAAAGPEELTRRLLLVPGVGRWTAAETTQRALGDADAVSVGDFHLSGQVGWALVGRRVDDAGMLELLRPYRPHRYRVVRHLLAAGMARVPRRGPRLAVEDHRRR